PGRRSAGDGRRVAGDGGATAGDRLAGGPPRRARPPARTGGGGAHGIVDRPSPGGAGSRLLRPVRPARRGVGLLRDLNGGGPTRRLRKTFAGSMARGRSRSCV